jgi:hypothetical protein
MSPEYNGVGGIMHRWICFYSRADHCRRQAIAARQHAAGALDPLSVKATFEEIANHWNALAEQVEWLERNKGRMARFGAKASQRRGGE